MFFVYGFVSGHRTQVRLKSTGRFWCLRCESECDYQHREWRSSETLFFVPVMGTNGGEFILCNTCLSAYRLECLDETSTAFYEELLTDAPVFAIETKLRPRPRTTSTAPPPANPTTPPFTKTNSPAPHEITPSPTAAPPFADRKRPSLSDALSANSAVRKH